MKEHILIADDEKEILSLLRLYLENSGYRVSWGNSLQPDPKRRHRPGDP